MTILAPAPVTENSLTNTQRQHWPHLVLDKVRAQRFYFLTYRPRENGFSMSAVEQPVQNTVPRPLPASKSSNFLQPYQKPCSVSLEHLLTVHLMIGTIAETPTQAVHLECAGARAHSGWATRALLQSRLSA